MYIKKSSAVAIMILACAWNSIVNGQETGKEAIAGEMANLNAIYRNALHLSFDIVYKYAAEEEPAKYLDSLKGHFKLNGDRYWYDLDNTESVCTKDYVIMLFKEDMVMYVATASNASVAAPIQGIGGGADSFFVKNKNARCSMQEGDVAKKITIEFIVPAVYKRIEYYIDKKTGYLLKMINVVRADQLYETSVRPLVENNGKWAIVESVYTNYQQNGFDDSLFNSKRYFTKEGNEYITVEPYTTYKVFLGKPGM